MHFVATKLRLDLERGYFISVTSLSLKNNESDAISRTYITTYTLASLHLETNVSVLLNEHIYKILYTASAGG